VRDFRALRREYERDGLDEARADTDPYVMFGRWMDEAIAAGLYEPNAMLLATVDDEGAPSARLVLLKGVTSTGWSSSPTTTRPRGGSADRTALRGGLPVAGDGSGRSGSIGRRCA